MTPQQAQDEDELELMRQIYLQKGSVLGGSLSLQSGPDWDEVCGS